MSAIVVSAFPCCGKTYAYQNYQDKYKIADSDSSKFSWLYRKRTPDELEEAKKCWESTDHLLSSDGYINQIKDKLVKVRNPEFPNNYIKHIKENLDNYDFIFVSSHLAVRQALTDNNIPFITVYPDISCKTSWIGRMYLRGNEKFFIDFQAENWDKFVNGINDEPHGMGIIRLEHDEYINLDKITDVYNMIKLREKLIEISQ